MSPRHPYLDHPGPIPFAHRGGAEEAPENTMAAFAASVRLGYRYVETDVHATADGRLVAFHDDTLDRVTDRRGTIGALPWTEVAAARVAGGEGIPLLEDLLGAWPDLRVNIDPKTDGAAELLPAVLERLSALDRICVGSFSEARLRRLRRRMGSALCTSMGMAAVWRLRAHSLNLGFGGYGADCAQLPATWCGLPVVDRLLIARAHRLDMPVHVWTVNDEPEMQRLLDLGVDGLMTDRPGLLKRVLEARGAWRP